MRSVPPSRVAAACPRRSASSNAARSSASRASSSPRRPAPSDVSKILVSAVKPSVPSNVRCGERTIRSARSVAKRPAARRWSSASRRSCKSPSATASRCSPRRSVQLDGVSVRAAPPTAASRIRSCAGCNSSPRRTATPRAIELVGRRDGREVPTNEEPPSASSGESGRPATTRSDRSAAASGPPPRRRDVSSRFASAATSSERASASSQNGRARGFGPAPLQAFRVQVRCQSEQERRGVVFVERPELQLGDAFASEHGRQRSQQLIRLLGRARRREERERLLLGRSAPDEVMAERERQLVQPLEVVDHEQRRVFRSRRRANAASKILTGSILPSALDQQLLERGSRRCEAAGGAVRPPRAAHFVRARTRRPRIGGRS